MSLPDAIVIVLNHLFELYFCSLTLLFQKHQL